MTALRQFLARAILIDIVIYRDLVDKYMRGLPKRRIERPRARPGSLQELMDRK